MKKKLILLLLILSVLTLSCLSGSFLPDRPIPARNLTNNDEYDVIWSLSNMGVEYCAANPSMVSTPGIIFVDASHSGLVRSLFAINSVNGKTLWEIKPSPPNMGVILAQDKILYRAAYGAVQAYNTDDGKLRWETTLPPGGVGQLYLAENKIFVSTVNDQFFILSNQGNILDHRVIQAKVYGEMNGIRYLQNNAFRAIDVASGHELWQVVVDRFGFWSSPIFDQGTIFLRTADVKGVIFSIDQSTGKVNWKVLQNMYSNLFLANGKIYFLSSDGYLVAIDRSSGAELSKVQFSALPFKLRGDRNDYCISGDPANNVLTVAFGDNDQLLGLKIKKP